MRIPDGARPITGPLTEARLGRVHRTVAKERRSVEDAVREAVVRWSLQVLGEDPWKELIGCMEDGPIDASSNSDDLYLED